MITQKGGMRGAGKRQRPGMSVRGAAVQSSSSRSPAQTAPPQRDAPEAGPSSVACQAETPSTSTTSSPPSLNPWQRYCIALDRQPFLTKACTSLVGFMMGDCLAQKLEGVASLDLGRVLHLGAYGFFLDGPVGHMWYKWLDGTVDKNLENSKGTAAVAIKTSADQLIWAPIMTCFFFAFLKVLEGHPELAISTVQEKVLPTVAANYVIWPAAHIVSFKYVPSHQRILYNNVIAIFWNCYLSIVASGGNMDLAALGGVDANATSQLAGLHDIAQRVQSTLPYDGFWIRELLDLNNPIGSGAAQLAARGASSPFIESVLQMQSMAMGR